MRSRIATVLTTALLFGGTAGAIAIAGQGSSGGPTGGAASGQYCNHKQTHGHGKCKGHHKHHGHCNKRGHGRGNGKCKGHGKHHGKKGKHGHRHGRKH
jgi:hypothetical protein